MNREKAAARIMAWARRLVVLGQAWGPALRRARRLFAAALSLMNGLGTVAILGLMLLINADIIGRAFFGAPISGVPEMVALSIVGIVFLQLAHTLQAGRLTRSDALLRYLKTHAPRALAALETLFNLAGAALMGALLWSSAPLLAKAWRQDDFVGSIGDFTAPVWPVKLIIVIGVTATGIQFLLNAWDHGRRALTGAGLAPEAEDETA